MRRETAAQGAERLRAEAEVERLRQMQVAVSLLQGQPLHVVKHGRQGRPKARLLFTTDHAKTLFWMPVPPAALSKPQKQEAWAPDAVGEGAAEDEDDLTAGAFGVRGGEPLLLLPRTDRSMVLEDVTQVLRGRRTLNFLRSGRGAVQDDDRCISLVTDKRTLDLEFPRAKQDETAAAGGRAQHGAKKARAKKGAGKPEPPTLSDDDFEDLFVGLCHLQEVKTMLKKPFGAPTSFRQ